MRTVTKDNITEVFESYFGGGTDPRLRQVLVSLGRDVHNFAREGTLTHDEWRKGLEILRHTGDITDDKRNEFVLLSDALSLPAGVEMLHSTHEATSSSVLGPFHVSNPPALPIGGDMKRDFGGPVLLVEGRVTGTDGEPVPGATLDIWQTAPNGLYSSQDEDQDIHSFHALMTADDQGRFSFTTVRPVSYTVPTDGPVGEILNAAGRHPWRPSHLHYIITAKGYRSLVTEVFPSDDPYLNEDTVFGVRDDLVMEYSQHPAHSFPDGFALSGKINEPYLRVKFDLILARS